MTFYTGAADASGNLAVGPFVCFTGAKSKLSQNSTSIYPAANLPSNCTGFPSCTGGGRSDGSVGAWAATASYCVKGS